MGRKAPNKPDMTAKIREHISKTDGPFHGKVMARELGIPGRLFYHLLRPMRLRGEIEKVERGWYRYKKVALYKMPSKIRPRLLRAMHIKIRFSTREIALLTDTYPSLAKYLVNRLLKTGEIEVIGRQRTPQKKWERVFRIKNRDEFFLKHIHEGISRTT